MFVPKQDPLLPSLFLHKGLLINTADLCVTTRCQATEATQVPGSSLPPCRQPFPKTYSGASPPGRDDIRLPDPDRRLPYPPAAANWSLAPPFPRYPNITVPLQQSAVCCRRARGRQPSPTIPDGAERSKTASTTPGSVFLDVLTIVPWNHCRNMSPGLYWALPPSDLGGDFTRILRASERYQLASIDLIRPLERRVGIEDLPRLASLTRKTAATMIPLAS